MSQDEALAETSNLTRLIYYSRNKIHGTFADVAVEVDKILETARKNNPPLGITGALIFNGGIFAQVLEGPLRGIEITLERIQRDPRHGEVHILACEKVTHRSFPSWSMAFVGRSHEARDLFSHIGEATGFEAKLLEGERILEIIQAIAVEEETTGAIR